MGWQGAKGGPGRDQSGQGEGLRNGGEPLVVSHSRFLGMFVEIHNCHTIWNSAMAYMLPVLTRISPLKGGISAHAACRDFDGEKKTWGWARPPPVSQKMGGSGTSENKVARKKVHNCYLP